MWLIEYFAQFKEPILTFVRDHKEWAAPVVFVLAFGESLAFLSLILPFWGILFLGIGPLLAASDALNFWTVASAAAIGAALGDWLSYWLGYYYHEEIERIWPLSRYPDLIPRGHKFFARWGAWAIVLGRFSGPFRASVPIVAGIARMPAIPFQLANWGSAFLWAGGLLALGKYGMEQILSYLG